MFKKLFNPESGLMITMTQLTDCIFLSLFWLIGCVPVVTVGASFAALYDASYRGFRQGEKNSWQRFWKVYRDNWKGSILPTLVFSVVFGLLVRILILLWNGVAAGALSWAVFSGGAFVGALVLGMLSVLFPVLSRFDNSFGMLMKNTVLLTLANLPRTLCLGILNGLCLIVCVRYVFPVFFLPSLAALIGSLLIEPMFKPYMPREIPEDAA